MPTNREIRDPSVIWLYRARAESPQLTHAEQRELIGLAQAGDMEAKATLFKSTYRFIWQAVTVYGWVPKRVALSDRIQAAFIGLEEALEGFDLSYGTAWLTYAGHKIRNAMSNCARLDERIILPHEVYELMHMKDEECKTYVKLDKKYSRFVGKLRSTFALSDLGEMFDAEGDFNGFNAVDDSLSLSATLERLLGVLDDKEAEVIRLRYGIGTKEHSLNDIGKLYGKTRQRIKQIETKAFAKMCEAAGVDPSTPMPKHFVPSHSQQPRPKNIPRPSISTIVRANIPA